MVKLMGVCGFRLSGLEELAKQRLEPLQVDGLAQVRVHARRVGLFDVLGEGVGGEGDDGHPGVQGADAARGLKAVHDRHLDVHEDEFREDEFREARLRGHTPRLRKLRRSPLQEDRLPGLVPGWGGELGRHAGLKQLNRPQAVVGDLNQQSGVFQEATDNLLIDGVILDQQDAPTGEGGRNLLGRSAFRRGL